MIGTGATLAAALTGTGLAGGFDRVPEPGPPAAAVGEVNHGQPWNVRVTQAVLFDGADLEPVVSLTEETNHWLVVAADVEITTPESRTDIDEALFPTGIDGIDDGVSADVPGAPAVDQVVMVRDDSTVVVLHPGLPEQIAFLWERASDAAPPAAIEVQIVGKTLRENFLDQSQDWLDPAVRAAVTVPLEDRRGDS